MHHCLTATIATLHKYLATFEQSECSQAAVLQVTDRGVESHLVQPELDVSGIGSLTDVIPATNCSLQLPTAHAGTFTISSAVKRQCSEE